MNTNDPFYAILLMIAILVCLEIGRRLGRAHLKASGGSSSNTGSNTIETAIFALFGLLLAFTFSGATTRFEQRRDLVVQEANSIGTAYLRLNLLEQSAQNKLRPLFRDYVESRLRTYESIRQGEEGFKEGLAKSTQIQNSIWQIATQASEKAGSPAVMELVLPPINDMIDITTTRIAAMRTHPPVIIYSLLVVFSLAGALMAGYGMAANKARQWLHMLLFAFAIAATIYVVLDIEHPRQGFIRVDGIDIHLIELLESMKKD